MAEATRFEINNYYYLLAVSQDAPRRDIDEAHASCYKALQARAARGDEEANKKVAEYNKAKETLANPEARAAYDRQPDSRIFAIQDIVPAVPDRTRRMLQIAELLRCEDAVQDLWGLSGLR